MKKPIRTDSPEYLLSMAWLNELAVLLARHHGLGITPDLASMSLIELYGPFLHLSRMGG